MQYRIALVLGVAATVAAPLPVVTAKVKLPQRGNDFSLPDEPREKVEDGTENIFGQSDGSDVNAERKREASVDFSGRLVRRGYDARNAIPGKGRYFVLSPKLSLQYGVTDDFEVEVSAFGDLRNVRGTPGLDDKSTPNFQLASHPPPAGRLLPQCGCESGLAQVFASDALRQSCCGELPFDLLADFGGNAE